MKGKAKNELSDKQKRFCKEYLIDLNGTQAAIRSGYSANSAMEQSYQLLQKTSVQEYLSSIRKKDEAKLDVSRERLIKELASIAMSDIRNLLDENGDLRNIKDLDDDSAAALSSIEVEEKKGGNYEGTITNIKKIKRWDKVKAIERLCKILGYDAPEKHELEMGKSFFDYLKETSR